MVVPLWNPNGSPRHGMPYLIYLAILQIYEEHFRPITTLRHKLRQAV